MELKFRDLTKDDIEVRVASVTDNGCSLLLYKDARVDMDILDETVGAMNWTRSHSRENANCTVSIWDSEKGQWISKEDTGTESLTEKEKGLASDSFKRACFNWGIGRELYTAPFIFVPSQKCKIDVKNNKKVCYDKFKVENITIVDKEIKAISIINTSRENKRVFAFGFNDNSTEPKEDKKINEPKEDKKINENQVIKLNSLICNLSNIEKFYTWLKSEYDIDNIAELKETHYESVLNLLRKSLSKSGQKA